MPDRTYRLLTNRELALYLRELAHLKEMSKANAHKGQLPKIADEIFALKFEADYLDNPASPEVNDEKSQ